MKLTSVLDSHLVDIVWRFSTTAGMCSDTPTLPGPLQRPHEVDHRPRLLLWTPPSPPSSSAQYVPTTRTDLPLLQRPAEVDHGARLPPCGHLCGISVALQLQDVRAPTLEHS